MDKQHQKVLLWGLVGLGIAGVLLFVAFLIHFAPGPTDPRRIAMAHLIPNISLEEPPGVDYTYSGATTVRGYVQYYFSMGEWLDEFDLEVSERSPGTVGHLSYFSEADYKTKQNNCYSAHGCTDEFMMKHTKTLVLLTEDKKLFQTLRKLSLQESDFVVVEGEYVEAMNFPTFEGGVTGRLMKKMSDQMGDMVSTLEEHGIRWLRIHRIFINGKPFA